jgi:NADPH-dependent 2,4-dienoyl-CoA reductase/sulfur reductase-like enzyme
MKSDQTVVIAGASIAGITAAEALRVEGFAGDILLIGDEEYLPYNRPPLSKQMLLNDWDVGELEIVPRERLENLGISLRLGESATDLDTTKNVIRTDKTSYGFDSLIIATGSKPRIVPETLGLPTLRTIADSLQLRKAIKTGASLGIIGAGVLGSEIASAAVKLGCRATLIGKPNEITFGGLGGQLSHLIEPLHLRNGVELFLGRDLERVTSLNSKTKVEFKSGETKEFDFVLSAIGTIPCTQWLEGSGLEITNGVICDSRGQAGPGIFAIGDLAAWPNPIDGKPSRTEHQSGAIEQALAVASYIAKGTTSRAPIPLFWSDIHDVKIKAYGWFAGGHLEQQTSDGQGNLIFTSKRDGLVQGAISWNSSTKEFREARRLVDESIESYIS